MKNRYYAIAAGLALTAVLAGCAPSAQTGRQASYIDMESAKTAALTAAQVDSADASFTKAELDQNNGMAYYEVRFSANGQDYYYAVDAMTGTVIESGNASAPQEAAAQDAASGQQSTVAASGQISEDEAKRIALADADVLEADTAYMNVRLDYDDGVQVFDVEFYVAATSTEYDYEINAADGSIRSMDYDAEGYTSASSGTTKSEQEIRDIALAKVPGATADDVRLHLDNDDGRLLYEGTIIYQNMKYEFEIDAYSGAIREWDAESVFD